MTTVDLSFPIRGDRVARDHGYPLYAALSRAISSLHEAEWLAVHPLTGFRVDENALELRPASELRLRLPVERIGDVLPLAGASLDVGGAEIKLGAPRVHPLTPRACLDARLVAIKLTEAPHRRNHELGRDALDLAKFAERYACEIKRQLAEMEIDSTFELRGRRSLTVGGRRIVGYSVRVLALNPDESITLQEKGLGGKRRMGCGVFRGTRGP